MRDILDDKRDKMLREMVAQGAICCEQSAYRATFHSFGGVCHMHRPAGPHVVAARLRYLDKHGVAYAAP